MKKKRENIYSLYQKQVKDKDTAVSTIIDNTLAKTQSMFVYTGLPETIPSTALERILQTNGNCFVTEVNGALYALQGNAGGELDPYDRPTVYTVANPALQLNRNYNLFTDGVYWENDTNGNSLLPIIGKYAVLLTDGVISLNTVTVLSRITMLISASDDKTKQSADEFVEKILAGDFSVIGENAFFKGVNLQHAPTAQTQQLTRLIETIQYFKASMLNELGLNSNFNMKRERLNLGEVSMNEDVLLPYVDNMLKCRQTAVEKINEKYGTEITVALGSSWNLNHENYEKQVADVDTENAPTAPVDDDQQEQPTPAPVDDEQQEQPTDPDEQTETTETEKTSETTETVETTETKETDETKDEKENEV